MTLKRSLYDALPYELKEKVYFKLEALRAVRVYEAAGYTRTAAVRVVAQKNGVSASTIFRWLERASFDTGTENAASALSPLHEPSMRALLFALVAYQPNPSVRARMANAALACGWNLSKPADRWQALDEIGVTDLLTEDQIETLADRLGGPRPIGDTDV